MISLRSAILALVLIAAHTPVCAAAMTIDGNEPREAITVTIREMGLGDVLRDFGKTYGFEVVRLDAADQSEPFSAAMTGSLEDILTRLLRNMNHVIVRSPDNRSGIGKVILFGESAVSGAPRQQETAPREDTSRDAQRQYSAQQGRD